MPESGGPQLEVTTEHTAAALGDGSAQSSTCARPYEREAGHIEGSATSPSATSPPQAESIDPERPVIFHCHVGSRSLMAAQAFRQAGFEAYSMAGGLEQWEQEGRPVQTGGA